MIFDQLFRKKQSITQSVEIKLPFKKGLIQNESSYFYELIQAFDKEEDLELLTAENAFDCLFGSPDKMHILYFGFTDLSILMTPNPHGWTAKRVFVKFYEGNEASFAKYDFLFKFPVIDKFRPFDDIVWSDWARVYG